MTKTVGTVVLCLSSLAAAWAAETVTLAVTNAPLADVLKEVSQQSGRKITLAAPSDRKVTLSLKDAPCESALRTICEGADCTFAADGEGFVVTPNTPPPSPQRGGAGGEVRPAAPEEVLLRYDFEAGAEPWSSAEPLGEVRVTTEPEHVRSGQSSLAYQYVVGGIPPDQQKKPNLRLLRELREMAEAGNLDAIKARLNEYLPEPKFTAIVAQNPGDLSRARSVRFWLKTSAATSLLLTFIGPWGGMYGAALYSPPNTWQHVWISLDRFGRDENAADVQGPVDLSQVTGIGFLDATLFLSQVSGEDVEDLQRWLWLDDFEVTTAEGPDAWQPRTRDGRRYLAFDDFTGGYIAWIPLSGRAGLETDEARNKPLLHWHYETGPGRMSGLIHPLGKLPANGPQAIRLRLKAAAAATLAVMLEEEGDKSSYSQKVEVEADPDWQEFVLDLKDFALDENKTDENGRLDLDQISNFMLIDASAMFGQAGAGDVWLDEVTLEME